MNYLQLVQRLKRESARSGAAITTLTDLPVNDQRLADWVNDAWLELQRYDGGWSWMRKSVAGPTIIGQRGYTAAELDAGASDFSRWLPAATEHYEVTAESVAGSPWPIRYLDWNTFRSRFEVREHVAGAPQFWSIAPDRKVYVGPTPDAVYTLRLEYFKGATSLADATASPEIDTEFHLILVWRALMELASFDAAPEVYSRANTNFTNMEQGLLTRHGPRISFATNRL